MEKFEKLKKENEPIVDMEVNPATLEYWEKRGLKKDILGLIKDSERYISSNNGRFLLQADSFYITKRFVDHVRTNSMGKTGAKNLEEKIQEIRDEVRKPILNFAFTDLGFDPKNPELIKQEKVVEETEQGEKKELIVKYFKINQENLLLGYDGIDWWLEEKE